jgi:hypothetical protein
MDWTDLAQDRDRRWAVVNAEMSLHRFHKMQEISELPPGGFSGRTLESVPKSSFMN